MSRGFVYVLTNESMPNLVKVGMTTRSVEQRVSELYQTGTPTPFEIHAQFDCPDCNEVERLAHSSLRECRVSDAREFFICPPDKAELAVRDAHREQVECWLGQFMPNEVMVASDLHVDEGDLLFLANKLGVNPEEVISAFHLLTTDEFSPALGRWKERVAERRAALSSGERLPPLRPLK